MYKYFPHTADDLKEMMRVAGVSSLDDLYKDVAPSIRFQGEYDMPSAVSEIELRQLVDELARHNQPLTVFAGAGIYDHYSPAVVQSIIQRSEYLTSYTPYQA